MPGPSREQATELYSQLRLNLVKTVYESWTETNFAWEQYNPETGAGQRTQHFTGWTALVVKFMAFPDLEETHGPSFTDQKLLPQPKARPRHVLFSFTFVLLIAASVILHMNRHRLNRLGSWLRRHSLSGD